MLSRMGFLFIYQLLLMLGQFNQAKKLCLKRIEKKPQELLSRTLLGHLFLKRGEYNQAIDQFETLVKVHNGDIIDYYNLIHALFSARRYGEVVRIGIKTFENFPGLRNLARGSVIANLNWYIAQAAVKVEDFNTAISNFNFFLRVSKRDKKFVYESLGYCYERIGKYDEAIQSYKKALSIDPNLSISNHNLEQLLKTQK